MFPEIHGTTFAVIVQILRSLRVNSSFVVGVRCL